MGVDIKIKNVALGDLRTDAVPPETREAFVACTGFDFLLSGGWYLAGGTALALQAGHRQSLDLDFFTEERDFDVAGAERLLSGLGKWVTTYTTSGTLYGLLGGAKMSFIAYPFFRPSKTYLQCGAVKILAIDDIAAMKIIAVSQRGKKRDFIDLYWYLAVHGASLEELLRRAIAQYPEQNHSMPHFLKSLVYFDDAEGDPDLQLHFEADWETIKEYFRHEVPGVAKQLLKMQ